ncbi:MAG: twin-arginine translocation signal domain-containing protein, partial [Haloferacaceae archaeon]
MDRRRFLTTVTAGTATAVAGCLGGESDEGFDVGMVYATGGLGDQSFNDMAHEGIQQAES